MQAPSPVLVPGDAGEEARAKEQDEEYKLIYHQTYKATVFAFRRDIESRDLGKEIEGVRDTVDKLLAIFCSDPLIAG